MIFNMVGGSSGAELNFSIVGSTAEPASPALNTIWVKTAASVPSWAMQASAPSSPTEGMVWFEIAMTGSAALNALKENALTIALASCRQYVSGGWTNKDAYLWDGEAWVQFGAEQIILFATGGSYAADWEGGGMGADDFTWGSGIPSVSATIADTGIVLIQGYNSSPVRYIAAHTAPIDVTNLSGIHFQANATGAATAVEAKLTATKTIGSAAAASVTFGTAGENAYTMDVSGLTGEYYLAINAVKAGSLGGDITVTITKVWCE